MEFIQGCVGAWRRLSDLERATFANINAAERIFWRNTLVPEIQFMEEQLTRMLLPKLGYHDLEVEFHLTGIEVLREDENSRVARDAQLLDRGVLTINEVRRSRNLPDVPWGDGWAKAPHGADRGSSAQPSSELQPSENGLVGVNGAGFSGSQIG